ncbi:MAG: two-component system response regulator NarL [Gammaproteobacteria bacterium]|nr:two-component system response regulator NarL [Gammaproteobacteria bacterium]MDH5629297.1 two-component system response regulator NarL [Gammaproteobacteria bacterium]
MDKYKIILVDDHPMLRKGVTQFIETEDNIEVIGEANNGEEAIGLAVKLQPDLIMLDLNMKGLSGIDTLTALKNAGIKSKVVIFSVSDNESDVLNALKFGADGYLLKDSEPEEIVEKIQCCLKGELVISGSLTQLLAHSLRAEHKVDPLERLTSREIEILKLISKGLSNKVIANKLNITEGTVKVHVKNMLKKLELRTRVEAAVWVVKKNIFN